jgi:hypothetical protein
VAQTTTRLHHPHFCELTPLPPPHLPHAPIKRAAADRWSQTCRGASHLDRRERTRTHTTPLGRSVLDAVPGRHTSGGAASRVRTRPSAMWAGGCWELWPWWLSLCDPHLAPSPGATLPSCAPAPSGLRPRCAPPCCALRTRQPCPPLPHWQRARLRLRCHRSTTSKEKLTPSSACVHKTDSEPRVLLV